MTSCIGVGRQVDDDVGMAHRLQPLGDLGRDFLYGIRLLRRSPGYSLVVITVLAVGIAANLIAFGLFKAIALAPLAGVRDSGSLLFLGSRTPAGQAVPLSYPDYRDVRARAFPDLAGSAVQLLILGHRGESRVASAEFVTGNYFGVLGVRAEAGRTIAPGDADRAGQPPIVVISHGLWQRAFGGDPAVIGATIRVNNQPLTIVGVADRQFHGSIVGLGTDLFVPVTMYDALTGAQALDARDDHWVQAFMRPAADRLQLGARAAQAGKVLAAEHPIDTLHERAVIVPLWQWPYGAQGYMLPAVGLMGAVAVLLLVVVSANVCGLVLVRGLSRRGETAARLTLGATRGRIMRQLTIESLVLAAPAAAIGFILPGLLESFLSAATANVQLPLFFNTTPDHLVIGFTVALAIASALIYGIVPAVRLSRVSLSTVLKGELSSSGVPGGRLRTVLAVAQIAGALVLLVGTALILRTLDAAQHANAGFDPRGVTFASFDARAGGYGEARGRLMYQQLLRAIRSDPGVDAAGLSAFLPLTFVDWSSWNVSVDGYVPRRDESLAFAVNIVSPGYFQAMSIPLVAGRDFEARDAGAPDVPFVVNETFARRFWGTPAAAIGRSIVAGSRHGAIVGVVRDIKYARLDEPPRPYLYAPDTHFYSASMTLQVHGNGGTAPMIARIREHARAIDPALDVLQSGAMADVLRSAASLYETLARMLTLIGALAVGVSALGVYGLLAYTVRLRSREIGVRTALGAPRGAIIAMFLRRGAVLIGIGTSIGVLIAIAVSRLMSSILLDVAATDVPSFIAATAVVTIAAVMASVVPAWRAARLDPVSVLRLQQ